MFDYYNFLRGIYIDEIKQFKSFLSSSIYETFTVKTQKEIENLKNDFNKKCEILNDLEIDCEYEKLKYNISLKTLSNYRFLSSLYMTLFSIWELQVTSYGKGIKKYYNETIKEFAKLVNTLKHGKKALPNRISSYHELKGMNSQYLNLPYDFSKIIPHIHGGEILNLTLSNLMNLCDEIINIWSNIE